MLFSDDMRDLIVLFGEHSVRYALIGGHAVNFYGYVRNTQDLDLLVDPNPENADRIMAALTAFGFGKAGIPKHLFEQEGGAVHLGEEPNRIDILTSLTGVGNDEIFENAHAVDFEGLTVTIIAFDDLLRVKASSGRSRDLADADELARIHLQE